MKKKILFCIADGYINVYAMDECEVIKQMFGKHWKMLCMYVGCVLIFFCK